MLNDLEFSALCSILQRAPMLPAEQIAIQQIVAKVQPKKDEVSDELPEHRA